MTNMIGKVIGIIVVALLVLMMLVLLFENHDFNNLGGIEKREFYCFRDHLRIRGTVFLPTGKINLPAAIVCHEFMTNRLFSYPYAIALARSGYVAFCFDFCGGVLLSSSDGSSRNMSVLSEIEDLRSVVTFVEGQKYVCDVPILLMGCSQGGLVAALIAAEMREKIGGLILQYPALSIPDDARKGTMLWMKFDPQHIPEHMHSGPMRLGECYVRDVITIDTFSAITKYTGKLLFIQGDKDKIATISNSQKATKAYKEAGAKVCFQVIPGGHHIIFSPKQMKQAIHAIMQFASQIKKTNT